METTLTKGQSYTDPMGNTGIVGFDSKTGKALADGGTTTITADSLAPMPEIKLPETTPETESQAVINTATAGSEVQKIADQAKAEKTTATSDISKLLSDIGVVEGKQNDYATQAGADNAKALSDKYQSSIDIESRALKNYTDNLYRDPNLTTTLVDRLATEQTRKSASTIADLSVAKAVVDRDYDRAISIAEKKVEAELAPLKRDLDAKKFIFDANIDLWNAGEKSILDNIIKKEERAYDEQVKTKNDIEALKIEARKNGAPDSVINAMKDVTTLNEALLAIGEYAADPLDRTYKRLQIQKLKNDISESESLAIVESLDYVNKPTELLASFFKKNPKTKSNQDLSNASAVISTAEQFAAANKDGNFRGLGILAKGVFTKGEKKDEKVANRAFISGLNLKTQQWASGASLTKQQEKAVMKLVPDKNDSDNKVQRKLNALTNYMLADIKGRVSTQGGSFEYVPVNFFSKDNSIPEVSIGKSVTTAMALGYSPAEIITQVEESSPELANMIEQARALGYSDEDILAELALQ